MLFADIKREVDYLSKKNFSGILRIGIEAGEIASVTFRGNSEQLIKPVVLDLESEIEKLIADESYIYGYVCYFFDAGKIMATDFTLNYQGQRAKEVINKCRNVRVVVKR